MKSFDCQGRGLPVTVGLILMHNRTLNRRRLLAAVFAGGMMPLSSACSDENPCDPELRNALLWAVAWKQSAAEYGALCYQAYNVARMQLELAIAAVQDKPLAVITDMDDTILHAGSYWGHLVSGNRDFFDDAIWDEWIPKNLVTAVPGSLDFLQFCHANAVEVFYVTSRDQGEQSFELALGHLLKLNFPYADAEHLIVFRDTSDKSPARERIAKTHEIAMLIGDNLNDYKRDYYVTDVEQRMALMQRDRGDFGRKFIVLPNPTDGHWVRAIFGESEPAPTDVNRRKLRAAATRLAWDGR
ncbi:MAG TPA: HAD family acid phosphatase [Woeseiaceae bacterium]|nr:HAD family acid phosphatase [Woeseiaceae bacterium]